MSEREMDRLSAHDVESSNIADVDYFPREQRLRITFRSGGVYDCAGVEKGRAFGLLTADSPGRYFAQMIRDQYACTKVEPPPTEGGHDGE